MWQQPPCDHEATVWRKEKPSRTKRLAERLVCHYYSPPLHQQPTTSRLFVTWQNYIPVRFFNYLRSKIFITGILSNKTFLWWGRTFSHNIDLLLWFLSLSKVDHCQSIEESRGPMDKIKVNRTPSLQTLYPSSNLTRKRKIWYESEFFNFKVIGNIHRLIWAKWGTNWLTWLSIQGVVRLQDTGSRSSNHVIRPGSVSISLVCSTLSWHLSQKLCSALQPTSSFSELQI